MIAHRGSRSMRRATASPNAAVEIGCRTHRRNVCRPFPSGDRCLHSMFDRPRFLFEPERPAQQHRRGEDRASRVRPPLPCDVRRAAVDRLVQAESRLRAGSGPAAEARRRQDADRSRQNRRFIRQDIAEHILGHNRRRSAPDFMMRCIAIASTRTCSSVTSGKSCFTSSTISRQSRDDSSTLDLSTLVTLPRRARAS